MGMYTAPGTRTGPNTVQRYPAGDPRRYANQGGVPPGSMPGKPAMPAPMPAPRPAPMPAPMPAPRPGGPQLIGGPVGRPIIGPPPAPMPSMPYGGPIAYPGGNTNGQLPGLPPGVGIQGGPFIPPGGLPTNGQGTGKSMDPRMQPQIGGNFGVDFGSPSDPGYNEARAQLGLPPIYDTPMGGGQPNPGNPNVLPGQGGLGGTIGGGFGGPQIGYGFNPNTGGVLGPTSQPLPNFANALGTQSPLLNTIRR